MRSDAAPNRRFETLAPLSCFYLVEAADEVLEEAFHLPDVLGDGLHLDANRLVNDTADVLWELRLELGTPA